MRAKWDWLTNAQKDSFKKQYHELYATYRHKLTPREDHHVWSFVPFYDEACNEMWWLLSAKGIETFAGNAGFDVALPVKDIIGPTHQLIVNSVHTRPINQNPNVVWRSRKFDDPPKYLDEWEINKNDNARGVYDWVWWFDERKGSVKPSKFIPNMKCAEE